MYDLRLQRAREAEAAVEERKERHDRKSKDTVEAWQTEREVLRRVLETEVSKVRREVDRPNYREG